jgi:hypothetical protein
MYGPIRVKTLGSLENSWAVFTKPKWILILWLDSSNPRNVAKKTKKKKAYDHHKALSVQEDS